MSKANDACGGITRRGFLKSTGMLAGAAAVGGAAAGLSTLQVKEEALADAGDGDEQVFYTSCRANCFQACMLKGHVRDGKVTYMSRGDFPEDVYSGCCLRGLSMHERAYSQTRIKYPMRRVGERGGDQWERISWEEAVQEIADSLTAIQEKYGKQAVAVDSATGNYAFLQGPYGPRSIFGNAIQGTLLNMCYDQAFGYGTNRVLGGGTWHYGNETKTMLDARHILVWGANPVYAQPQTWRIAQFAKERGAKVTCIDPMFSATAARSDEYIPVRPGTDLMVALAILNAIVSRGLIDVDYVKRYTTAPFLIRKDTGLLLRRSDIEGGEMAAVRDAKTLNTPGSMAKDPACVWDEAVGAWALGTECETPALEGSFDVEGIEVQTVYSALKQHVAEYTVDRAAEVSQIPADKIEELVRIYAEDGPVFLYAIYGIDHYRNGHLWSQTMAILHALTNNLSRPGSSVSGFGAVLLDALPLNMTALMPPSMTLGNSTLPQSAFAEVVLSGMYKNESYPLKAFIAASSNAVSNFADQNTWIDKVVPSLEFILTLDTEFTDTARYSDIVLPVAWWTEVEDLRPAGYCNPFMVHCEKMTDPLYEAKPDTEAFALIAEKMGVGDDLPLRDPSEWVDLLLDSDGLRKMGITPEKMREVKAVRGAGSADKPVIRGNGGKPWPTPSGRVELYCEIPVPRVDYGQKWQEEAAKEHFPYFKPPTENYYESELKKKYPLSYFQSHQRWRTHSQWFASKTLRELDPEPLAYLSREDAEERGIAEGDIVEVFNDRGHVVIKATITDAAPKGFLHIPKGWQRNQFIEGSYQNMTSSECDPLSVNFAFFDTLVDVRKQ